MKKIRWFSIFMAFASLLLASSTFALTLNSTFVYQDSLGKFTISWGLTDTADIRYLDVQQGAIAYKITNLYNFPILFKIAHNHIWDQSYCIEKGIDSVQALSASANDSELYFLGLLTPEFVAIDSLDSVTLIKSNLSAMRIFLVWDSVKKQTATTASIEADTTQGYNAALSNKAGIKVSLSISGLVATDQMGRTWTSNGTGAIHQVTSPRVLTPAADFRPAFISAPDNSIRLRFVVTSFSTPVCYPAKSRMIAIHIYNLKGSLIATPFIGPADIGYNEMTLHLENEVTRPVSHGLYLYKIDLQ